MMAIGRAWTAVWLTEMTRLARPLLLLAMEAAVKNAVSLEPAAVVERLDRGRALEAA